MGVGPSKLMFYIGVPMDCLYIIYGATLSLYYVLIEVPVDMLRRRATSLRRSPTIDDTQVAYCSLGPIPGSHSTQQPNVKLNKYSE